MNEAINTVGVIADIIIAGCALILLYISHREHISSYWGIKRLTGFLMFSVYIDHLEECPKACIAVFIRNNGLVRQEVRYLVDKGGLSLKDLFEPPSRQDIEITPGNVREISLSLTPQMIKYLEKAGSLSLCNKFGKKKKIASAEDIQRVLKEYREYNSSDEITKNKKIIELEKKRASGELFEGVIVE